MQKIIPNLWFQGDAVEGGEFYSRALPNTVATTTMTYPSADDLPEFQREFAGEALTVEVAVDGFRIVLINAGDEFRPNPAISFLLGFDVARDPDARAHLDQTWERLAEGGRERMPRGDYGYSERYGWIEDRFGVSWQLVLTDDAADPQPFVTPCLTFGADAQHRAAEAVAFYAATVPDSAVGRVVEYSEATGPADPGDVSYAEFRLAGEAFSAMDASSPQEESFSIGVSLQIDCVDQAEIDRLWAALSAVPAAEQCGWCVDRFGVSWQVVPGVMGDLVDSPAAYRAMMGMTKIDIAALRAAG